MKQEDSETTTALVARDCPSLLDALGPKQQSAALLLAAGNSQEKVAKEVGVCRRTIYTWLQKRSFLVVVETEASERFERLERKSEAKLDDLLDHDDPKIVLNAAAIVQRNKTRRVLHEYSGSITIEQLVGVIEQLSEADYGRLVGDLRAATQASGRIGSGEDA